jgi:hypothetical protein
VSLIEPDDAGGQLDDGEEVACGFVVAGSSRAELLESGENVSKQVACFLEIAIKLVV